MGVVLDGEWDSLDLRMRELLHVGDRKRQVTPSTMAAYARRRSKDRPLCPLCGADEARTTSGKRAGRVSWLCHACRHAWRNPPPGTASCVHAQNRRPEPGETA